MTSDSNLNLTTKVVVYIEGSIRTGEILLVPQIKRFLKSKKTIVLFT